MSRHLTNHNVSQRSGESNQKWQQKTQRKQAVYKQKQGHAVPYVLIEDGAAKVEPLLDIGANTRALQRPAHLRKIKEA